MQQLVQPSGPHGWVGGEERDAKTAEQQWLLEMVFGLVAPGLGMQIQENAHVLSSGQTAGEILPWLGGGGCEGLEQPLLTREGD